MCVSSFEWIMKPCNRLPLFFGECPLQTHNDWTLQVTVFHYNSRDFLSKQAIMKVWEATRGEVHLVTIRNELKDSCILLTKKWIGFLRGRNIYINIGVYDLIVLFHSCLLNQVVSLVGGYRIAHCVSAHHNTDPQWVDGDHLSLSSASYYLTSNMIEFHQSQHS